MLILMVILTLVFAFLITLSSIFNRGVKLTKILFLVGILIPWPIFLFYFNKVPINVVLGGWNRFTGIEVTLNNYNLIFILAELIIFSLVGFYSLNYFKRDELNKVFALFLLMHGGLLGTFISKDLFNYYIYMEIASASVFGLVALSNVKGSKKASFRYITFYFVASYLLILSIAIIYMETGYLNLFLIRENLVVSLEIKVALGLAFASLILKAGIFPLYFWLPDAHSKAQTPVSALLSGIMVKASVYGMMLISSHFPMRFMKDPLMIVAFSSMIFGVLIALMQNNVKRLLAYHTVSQLGYVLLGFATLNIQGAIYHAFAHAITKSGLFLGVGTLVHSQKTRDLKKLTYGGNYILLFSILMLSISISGIYPFIGSYSKIMLLSGIKGYWVHLFYFVNIGTLIYYAKLNYFLLKGNRKVSIRFRFSIVPLVSSFLVLGFGLYFGPTLKGLDLLVIVLSIIIFFILLNFNVYSFKFNELLLDKPRKIGNENNLLVSIFTMFLILILLQGL